MDAKYWVSLSTWFESVFVDNLNALRRMAPGRATQNPANKQDTTWLRITFTPRPTTNFVEALSSFHLPATRISVLKIVVPA